MEGLGKSSIERTVKKKKRDVVTVVVGGGLKYGRETLPEGFAEKQTRSPDFILEYFLTLPTFLVLLGRHTVFFTVIFWVL